jgi:hypothetical protein
MGFVTRSRTDGLGSTLLGTRLITRCNRIGRSGVLVSVANIVFSPIHRYFAVRIRATLLDINLFDTGALAGKLVKRRFVGGHFSTLSPGMRKPPQYDAAI